MQFNLQVFEYDNRQKFQIIHREGEPWFVLSEICRELEIANPRDAASRLDDDEKDAVGIADAIGRTQKTTIINESGLYTLILTSRKEGAKRFRKWVTSEVLPSIRRTGSYGHNSQIPAFIKRANENWDRVSGGYFSILSEVMTRIYGRFEMAGHLLADRSPSGKENRIENSVGVRFSKWLKSNHPDVADSFSYYVHKTPEWEGPVRQYPNSMLPLFIEFVETVWLPRCDEYLGPRDPAALAYLQKVLPPLDRARPGMMKLPSSRR